MDKIGGITAIFKNANASTYSYEMVKTHFFCPKCGKETVYEETGEGDYYEGRAMLCTSCSFFFTMPMQGKEENVEIIHQVDNG